MRTDDPYVGFQVSPRARETYQKLQAFIDAHVYPNEKLFQEQIDQGERWESVPLMEDLKTKARAEGLWNLFLPDSEFGAGLTNLEYAPMAELMGRSVGFAPEIFNCSAPDTGNMEVLVRYGTTAQKELWLQTTPKRRHSFVLRYDRTRRGFVGRDQHRSTIVRDGMSM